MPEYKRTTKTYLPSDHSWMRTNKGWDTLKTITLDIALFTAGTHFPNGFIPAGITLGPVTADTDVYGPYSDAAGDGRTVMAGFLFNAEPVTAGATTGLIIASLLTEGDIVEGRLPTGHGLNANGKTDVGARFTYTAA